MSRKLPEIKQRKDGYYEQKITVSTNVRKSVYGATPTEVRRKARELIAEAARYDISNVKKMTLERSNAKVSSTSSQKSCSNLCKSA